MPCRAISWARIDLSFGFHVDLFGVATLQLGQRTASFFLRELAVPPGIDGGHARVADPRNDALSQSRRCSASSLFAKGKSSRQFRNAGSTLVRAYICEGVDFRTACRPSTQTIKNNTGVSAHPLQIGIGACNWVSVLHCEHRGMPSLEGTFSPAAKITF